MPMLAMFKIFNKVKSQNAVTNSTHLQAHRLLPQQNADPIGLVTLSSSPSHGTLQVAPFTPWHTLNVNHCDQDSCPPSYRPKPTEIPNGEKVEESEKESKSFLTQQVKSGLTKESNRWKKEDMDKKLRHLPTPPDHAGSIVASNTEKAKVDNMRTLAAVPQHSELTSVIATEPEYKRDRKIRPLPMPPRGSELTR